MLNINDIAEQAHTLAERRGFKTDVVSALKHCAGEVVEACEANYKVHGLQRCEATAFLTKELGMELADIIICVLTASYEAGINIEEALSEAMMKNARRAYGTQTA